MRIAVSLMAVVLATLAGVGRSTESGGVAELPFEVLRSSGIGGTSIVVSRVTLARDEAAFESIWSQLKVPRSAVDAGTAPRVDFDRSMVVAFFASQGTDCDPYRVAQVLERPDRITLQVKHQLPWKCACASLLFEPYIIVRIPRTEKPVDFEIEPEFHECR